METVYVLVFEWSGAVDTVRVFRSHERANQEYDKLYREHRNAIDVGDSVLSVFTREIE